MKKAEYTFGTSAVAAARLGQIARYFNPVAAHLIRQFVTSAPAVAVDLGCGPGFTTHMLAEATGSPTTYGLDNSRDFLDAAARRFSHCTFLQHDVTQVPFTVTGDVMYARFLLCHLRAPLEVLAVWMTQMNPGGLLFVDEIDAIDTELTLFKTYLAMAEGIIASQGASLYLGSMLEPAEYEADVLLNEPTVLPVPNWQAASWFFSNTRTVWNENPYVLEHLTAEERKSIADELAQLKAKKDSRSDITWRLRRLVLRKPIA
jgi:trans-aconitate methyltransferase